VSASGGAKGAAAAPSSAKLITTTDPISRVLAQLRKNPNNRPRRQRTLMRHLAAQSLKGATEEEIEQLVATLVKSGHLEIDPKGSITYRLDDGSA
jgi:hypothetical protein